MTVATKDIPGGRGSARGHAQSGDPWRRLWQVPLLLLGLAGFGLGVRALVRTISPVPFEQQVRGVRSLIDAGEFAKAIEQINTLGRYYTQPTEQGELQILAGDVHYFAQKRQLDAGGGLVRANEQRVEEHYGKAVAWGVVPTAQIYERWGEAALALGDARTAVTKLEAAMAGMTPGGEQTETPPAAPSPAVTELIRRHGREMVMAYLELGARSQALTMVEKVLAADKESPKREGEPPAPSELEERTWALCQRMEIALSSAGDESGRQALAKAVDGARAVIKEWEAQEAVDDQGRIAESTGRVLVWIGRAELALGDTSTAEHDLTAAREHFVVHHLDDARASILLARIAQARGSAPGGTASDLERAAKLFNEVAAEQAGGIAWAAARLGRAEVAGIQGARLTLELLADYQFAVAAVQTTPEKSAPIGKKPEMVDPESVRASLLEAFARAADANRLQDALAILKLEEELGVERRPDYLYRLAATRERRGDELLKESDKREGGDRGRAIEAGRAMLAAAAADYLRHSRMTTLDDEVSGASLWKAAELFDRAGDTRQAAAAYERLTQERPRDPRVPEGLLALGRLYESQAEDAMAEPGAGTQPAAGDVRAGDDLLGKAIAVYERNIKENVNTPAAYASAVNKARCFGRRAAHAGSAQEREAAFSEAEAACLSLVQDNTNLQPAAREFREGLRALAELYFARGQWKGAAPRWTDAIYRLEELEARYADDPGRVRTLFLLAQSYYGSAAEIEAATRTAPVEQQPELETARTKRLAKAADHYGEVIALLDAAADSGGLASPAAHKSAGLEEAYLRSSYLGRAECFYRRGDFVEAIKEYNQAAARYSNEVTALDAYVRMVSAYLALKQPAQASAAAERGLWVLQRLPDTAFGQSVAGPGGAGRTYYQRMLALGKP